MKKTSILMAAAAAVCLVSCNNAPKGGDLKDEADTLVYALGMNMGSQIKDYAVQMGVDSAYLDEVVRGFEEGANIDGDAKKKAYAFGMFLAYQSMEGNGMQPGMREGLRKELYGDDSTKTVNMASLMEAFHNAALGKDTKFAKDSLQNIMETVSKRIQDRKMEAQYGDWKAQNEKFNKKIAADKSLRALGDGIYVKELQKGAGEMPAMTDKVKITYVGRLCNDTVFDDSSTHGGEIEMPLTGVVPGFAKALSKMNVGSKWIIYIPYEQGYGTQDMGQIKPFSTLIFEVEMKSIIKGDAAPQQPANVNLPQAEVTTQP